MNRTLIAIIATVAVAVISSATSCISFYDTANGLENSATAQVKSNMAEYDNLWKVVSELAQVPVQYKSDFKELVESEASAKFGDDGSKALAQWFAERDLHPPVELYSKLQTAIEAHRNTFTKGQQLLADKQRAYADHLGSVSGRMWSSITGHPKVISGSIAPTKDIDGDGRLTVLDYPIITSAKTEGVFSEGRDDEPLKVF